MGGGERERERVSEGERERCIPSAGSFPNISWGWAKLKPGARDSFWIPPHEWQRPGCLGCLPCFPRCAGSELD